MPTSRDEFLSKLASPETLDNAAGEEVRLMLEAGIERAAAAGEKSVYVRVLVALAEDTINQIKSEYEEIGWTVSCSVTDAGAPWNKTFEWHWELS